LASFAEIGLDAEWCTIHASQFGLPHFRERLFIVAYPGEVGWQTRHGERTHPPAQIKAECHAGRACHDKTNASAFPRFLEPARGFDDSAPLSKKGKLNPDFVEAMMGAPIGFTDGCGLSERQRIEVLGNGVAVPVAKFVGECAKKFITKRKKRGTRSGLHRSRLSPDF
jgi:site-specific DNA-cytosine methylase